MGLVAGGLQSDVQLCCWGGQAGDSILLISIDSSCNMEIPVRAPRNNSLGGGYESGRIWCWLPLLPGEHWCISLWVWVGWARPNIYTLNTGAQRCLPTGIARKLEHHPLERGNGPFISGPFIAQTDVGPASGPGTCIRLYKKKSMGDSGR